MYWCGSSLFALYPLQTVACGLGKFFHLFSISHVKNLVGWLVHCQNMHGCVMGLNSCVAGQFGGKVWHQKIKCMKWKCNKYPNESIWCIREIYLFIRNNVFIQEWLIIKFKRLQTAKRWVGQMNWKTQWVNHVRQPTPPPRWEHVSFSY